MEDVVSKPSENQHNEDHWCYLHFLLHLMWCWSIKYVELLDRIDFIMQYDAAVAESISLCLSLLVTFSYIFAWFCWRFILCCLVLASSSFSRAGGRRASFQDKSWQRRFKRFLPFVVRGNLRFLVNKMDELGVLTNQTTLFNIVPTFC